MSEAGGDEDDTTSVPANVVASAHAMACPRCGKAMDRGTATVRGTILGFALVGWSYQNLYFEGSARGRVIPRSLAEGSGRRVVLPSGESTGAFRCGYCGVTVLLPN